MPAAECDPSGATEFTRLGSEILAMALADPSRYFIVNKGPCPCCTGGACRCLSTMPDTLYYTLGTGDSGVLERVYVDGLPTNSWFNDIDDDVFPCEAAYYIQQMQCVIVEGVHYWGVAPPASGHGPCGNFIPVCCTPFYYNGPIPLCGFCDPPGSTTNICISTTPICPVEPPECPETALKWWCVPKATAPWRECVQGVTSAVGGPYATQAACEADVDCLPCNYYCVKLETLSGGVVVPNTATWECQQLTDVVPGQVIDVGDVRKTIQDGPFVASKCQCPPCSGSTLVEPTPDCNEPLGGPINYACLDGVCVPVMPGTEDQYGTLYPGDPTCGGAC